MSVMDNHNFELAAGIIAHNSGSKDESDSLCGAMYSASLSGVSTNIRYAAEDAETINDILMADSEFMDDLNSMFGLGNAQVMNDDSEIQKAMGDSSDFLFNDMVW